jgi:hypothetical protein
MERDLGTELFRNAAEKEASEPQVITH